MTREDKELLLKDLCARLPYGLMVNDRNGDHILTLGNTELGTDHIKPYLRPMSSMTDEEVAEFSGPAIELELDYLASASNRPSVENMASSTYQIDFCLKNHFDFRGLIEKGLAIEVTDENNPYK